MPGDPLLSLAFLLSGAAGLIFQVVWFHRAGLVLGNSLATVTIVLSSFMAGLALGNSMAPRLVRRWSKPIHTYAWLEVAVALSGLAVSVVLPRLTSVIAPIVTRIPETSPLVNVIRFGTAFGVLVVPATAMGATLPVLVGALARRDGATGFGRVLGRLYGWNTAGAVLGVLFAEIVAIATVGMTGTASLAAALNLAAAAVASIAARSRRGDPLITPALNRQPVERVSVPRAIVLAAGLAGALLLGFEVLWFRFLSLYVLSTTLAVSLMLAVVLSGIAVGGWIAAGWLRIDRDASRFIPTLSFAAGSTAALAYVAFQWTTSGTQIGEWYRVLWLACALTLPTSIVSGGLFTLLGDVIREGQSDDTEAAATLTLANTAGALVGPLLATFVLLPALGLESSVFVLAVSYGAMGALVMHAFRNPSSRRRAFAPPRVTLVASGSLIVVLAVFTFAAGRGAYFQRAADAYAADGSRIVAVREGPSETIFLMQQPWMGRPVYSRLVTNGFSMTGTAVPGQRYMRYFAYWPMLVHDGPINSALLVCYGAGVTASALLQIPSLQSLDIAEISRDVAAMSDLIYAPDRHPLRDPRVNLHVEDGRYLLETTRDRYDVITGEPPPPRTPGTVNIYTREFFQLVFDHLNEGGVATYWLPVGRPQPGTDVDTVIRAFCDVFEDCSLWNATPFDFMLAGTRGARGPVSREQFEQPWQTPGLQATLRELGFERPEQIGATFLGDARDLRELTADVPELTDNFPQRLRPGLRPSLSDPRYGTNAAVRSRFEGIIAISRTRHAFQTSPFILQHWPESLIGPSDRYFGYQEWLNDVLWNGARPLARIAELDDVLTTTALRTLPLWMLGSDDVKQAIAESVDDGTGASDYAKALRGLSGRDYRGAAALLQRAEQRGLQAPTIRPLLAYALMKGGRLDEAKDLMRAAQPSTEDEREFWRWLTERLR